MDKSLNDMNDYDSTNKENVVGSIFCADYKKNDDLKQMLDTNRDNIKLEAMKRIIGMVAKGRDASDLFPAVVKNVVAKNTEVKKLVYVYLVRYAEEQQDLALLSISTFQRALKDPNQLIRASALRVLSSIRVEAIVPIVLLAIRDASSDMSPYVRKTAAHAIPKLFSLDPEQKDELIQILDKLLADKTTLVVGSAVMAFEEVCPERVDLIHKNYRKFCALLIDVDEWGQVVILNMLTRYGRSQFINPNLDEEEEIDEDRPFYDDDENEEGGENGHSASAKKEKPFKRKSMDPDHRLLMKNSRPLLQSRNAAVVMAVAQLFYHLAPKSEVQIVVRALIRILRSHTEVQAVVLTCIAAMATTRKYLFEPHMKNFFVRSSDPTQIKLLKLEILTLIANESNIPPILREFQAYISSQDKDFIAATIQAIGRCASNIKEVAETCLNGLVSLLSHRDPAVVGEAVVVAKTLLQTQKSSYNRTIVTQLAKMVDRVTIGPARAAILWLLGEHSEKLPNLPPDVLRKMAKTFPDEEDVVKQQIMNLAAKLHIINPEQTTLLCQYILNMAKYDQSYDIRDRARFLRHLLFNENAQDSKLSKYAKKILLSSKPAPILDSRFKDRHHFQLGSLSHFLNTKAVGYRELPNFPETAPDPSLRIVEEEQNSYKNSHSTSFENNKKGYSHSKKKTTKKTESSKFYSSSEDEDTKDSKKSSSGSGSSSSSSSSGTSDSESDSKESDSGEDSKSNSESEASEKKTTAINNKTKALNNNISKKEEKQKVKVVHYNDKDKEKKKAIKPKTVYSSLSSDASSSSTSGPDEEHSTSSDEEDEIQNKSPNKGKNKANQNSKKKEPSNVDLLLDFSSDANESSAAVPQQQPSFMMSTSDILAPSTAVPTDKKTNLDNPTIEVASAKFIPTEKIEILNKIIKGLGISYRFTRMPHLASSKMVSLELEMQNHSSNIFNNIRISNKNLPSGMSIVEFHPVKLDAGKTAKVNLGIDFNDTMQEAKMDISWEKIEGEIKNEEKHSITIKAKVGEILRPIIITSEYFTSQQTKLRGMNMQEVTLSIKPELLNQNSLNKIVYETANILQVPSLEDPNEIICYAGQSLSTQTLILITLHLLKTGENSQNNLKIVINCEKIVFGSMLLRVLMEELKKL